MTSDPKPAARIRDTLAMRRFRLLNIGEPCEVCELRPGTQVHHRALRSQGGDDVEENFAWVCHICQVELHDASGVVSLRDLL